MDNKANSDRYWTVAGFDPSRRVRMVLSGIVAFLCGLPVLSLVVECTAAGPLPPEARTVAIAFAAAALVGIVLTMGFRMATVIDRSERMLTDSWDLFGVGPRRTWPLSHFDRVWIERRFYARTKFSRIRYQVAIQGGGPEAIGAVVSLGAYRQYDDALTLAECVSAELAVPVDYVDNATFAHAWRTTRRILALPIKIALFPFWIGWWPVFMLFRGNRTNRA